MSLVGEPRVNHAVERDAVPGQLAVRFNKVPKASARLGRGVGGRHSAAGASGREDRCSEYAELGDGRPPCLNIDHPDLEKDSYKTHSNLSERFQILVASAPQRSCMAWQTGQADPRSKLRVPLPAPTSQRIGSFEKSKGRGTLSARKLSRFRMANFRLVFIQLYRWFPSILKALTITGPPAQSRQQR